MSLDITAIRESHTRTRQGHCRRCSDLWPCQLLEAADEIEALRAKLVADIPIHERLTPTPVTCRKCGAEAGPPTYSDQHYGGRPALFWTCPNGECAYTWTLLIYASPETEIGQLRDRVKDLDPEGAFVAREAAS